jgi:arginine decarboxylase
MGIVGQPAASGTQRTVLSVHVVSAVGRGPTALAAFDGALVGCGVANFNLVRLSSVIPPGAAVTKQDDTGELDLRARPAVGGSGGWGDRLYAVWAFQAAERLGEEAWAGVAWVQDPSDGRGLFVEHEGHSESTVRRELEVSLTAICRPRGLSHLRQRSLVIGARCEGEPVGALVIAPYLSLPWTDSL